MKDWYKPNRRVQHTLSRWQGTVISNYFNMQATIAVVRFWDNVHKVFVELDCVESELCEPKEKGE